MKRTIIALALMFVAAACATLDPGQEPVDGAGGHKRFERDPVFFPPPQVG